MMVLAIILLALYFAPALIAAMRSHRNALAIFLLNLLLGWTLIGWVLAIVWAAASSRPQTIIVQQAAPRSDA